MASHVGLERRETVLWWFADCKEMGTQCKSLSRGYKTGIDRREVGFFSIEYILLAEKAGTIG